MLTKETAIARLRATGTLGLAELAVDTIDLDDAKEPLARTVNYAMQSNARSRGVRMVAPGANQAVLP